MSYRNKKILITGATGFIGTNLINRMKTLGYSNLAAVSSRDYDLLKQENVKRMFTEIRPDIVVHLAAYVGGILANKSYPADFIYRNLTINTQVIHEASAFCVEKLMTCIGGCSYPNTAQSPISEESLFNGLPAKESAPYSMAKAIGFLQVKSYREQYNLNGIVLVPGNVYGPHDNFSRDNSHVIPGLIRKIYDAKKSKEKRFVAWGTGKPVRDFVYIQDAVDGLIKALEEYNGPDLINISSGIPTSIKELVGLIAKLSDFDGEIVWDASKPDGKAYKIFDVTRMRNILNYECRTSLKEGLEKTIEWFNQNYGKGIIRLE
jgi:GDP-L-fucose synthase